MLNDDNITTLVNNFVKMGLKVGLQNGCGGGRQIALFRYDDGWGVELVEHTEKRLDKAVMHFDYPMLLPDDDLDAAIELAGLISVRLHDWVNRSKIGKVAGKVSASKLTPEERSARAKKAVEARIKKYGQKTGTASKADGSGR